MIQDKDFLLQLDRIHEKEIYAKVTALTFHETPTETIEGRVTGGTINVDGNSAVRRTCSLTIVADNFDYNDYYWGLNTKFKLEIGVKNNIQPKYPDIIWFPQGVFVLTSFNTSRSTSHFTITLQGKDKMCLLNGEVGGNIEASTDFGTISTVNEVGYSEIEKIPIKDIIRNMVHHYAGEPYYNIIINDLDTYGLELMEYRYDDDLYLYRKAEKGIIYYDNILIDGDKECTVAGKPEIKKLSDLGPNELEMLVETLTDEQDLVPITMEGNDYYVTKVSYGQTAGYRETELTYPGDLIANIGETITSILDKIKNMLSDFEYFYNLDGQFVFQRKQAFVNTLWSPTIKNEDEQLYVDSLAAASPYSYIFNGAELISSFTNNPNMLNMRNDYAVWGVREAIGRSDPVHMRYAIDLKPIYYKAYDGSIYISDASFFDNLKETIRKETIDRVTNRLETYQMKHEIPSYLKAPTQLANGDWTAGWWDIRDWHDYYVALTLEEPKYTMKWYSRNDETGCIPANMIPGYENSTAWTWMIVATTYKQNGKVELSFGHGSGQSPESGRIVESTKKESYYDENGVLQTVVSTPVEKRMIVSPYYGCDDTHTYLYFLTHEIKETDSYTRDVYFYNPNFPSQASFEDVVEEQIEKEYQEYIKNVNYVDWREVIYKMALDYFQHGTEDDFEIQIRNNNLAYYPSGRTGYEQYYTDLQGHWRTLYNPELEKEITKLREKKEAYDQIEIKLTEDVHTSTDIQKDIAAMTPADTLPNNIPYIDDMILIENDKIAEMENISIERYQELEHHQTYLTTLQLKYNSLISQLNKNRDLSSSMLEKIKDKEKEIENYYDQDDLNPYWHKAVYEAPETLTFWFDFLDEGELSNFNVKTVGARPKVINDSAVKSIYFRETPNIIFVTADEWNSIQKNSAYKYIQVNDIEGMFRVSSQTKSAKDRLDELIYAHSYSIENVTINAIPIYYLQPNTRIHLFDEKAKLNGDYIISKITIPLTYNGTMQITATKAAENII